MRTIINLILCCLVTIAQGKQTKIIRGYDADPDEPLFTVSLQYSGFSYHICGGSIYNENYVITAAHCVFRQNDPDDFQITTGINYDKPDSVHKIVSIQQHEKFDPKDSGFSDIALIKVTPPFEFSEKLSPVVLPEPHLKIPPKQKAVIYGWGYTDPTGSDVPSHLQEVQVTVVDEEYCRHIYNASKSRPEEFKHIFSRHLCTHEVSEVSKGSCNGDSGGPLVMHDNVLIGIVSWSRKDPECASKKFPDVFTRVSEYIDWIKKHAT